MAQFPQGFAFDLARPMPGRPTRAADRGTRFHAWVESRFGQQPLLLPDDLPGAADEELSEADLEVFKANFEASVYARRGPIAIERPFALVLAGCWLATRPAPQHSADMAAPGVEAAPAAP